MNLRAEVAEELGHLRESLGLSFVGVTLPRSYDLIAIGKAATPMVDGVLADWAPELAQGLVVLPDGAPSPKEHPRLRVLRASHPLPDVRSVAAGTAVLELAREGTRPLYVLISGGTSALVAVPVPGIDLDVLREVSQRLLLSGADVRAINVVRRHLSLVHGGGIVNAARGRPVVVYIVSDVIDGEPHDIGSGPASPDPTTVADARAVVARFAPALGDLPLVETLKPADVRAASISTTIGLDPRSVAEGIAQVLGRSGFAATVLPSSTADVRELSDEYIALARSMAPNQAFVRAAEPKVVVPVASPGKGGRCCHLAALVARDLPPPAELLAAATDGVDGSSETGGAVVRGRSYRKARKELDAAIAAFDTGSLHRAHGNSLPCVPTGVNFADVHVLVRHGSTAK